MMFIAIKTKDGVIKGKLSFYCRMLGVSRQGFYKYLAIKDRPWKYQDLADAMRVIHAEDECNDTYGRIRMYQALLLKNPAGIKIPSERTVYRVMDEIGLVHRPKRKPNGITKADREARKSDDLLKREFKADKPLEKCVTDITEIKAKDGKLYVSAIFDCFDSSVLGLAMETNMKATLCEHTLDNAYLAHPDLRGAIVHSDRGRQYTSETYRQALSKYGIIQSMNSDGGRCHDNARCESMWARMKSELLYDRYNTELMSQDELATMDGGKCILQIRGVRPFLSDKFDLTKHPNYKYLSDADPANAFDPQAYLNRALHPKDEDTFDAYEIEDDEPEEDVPIDLDVVMY